MTVSSTPTSARSRPRICLLLDTVRFAYQNDLLLGVHEQCEKEGYDLYCLSGGRISTANTPESLYGLVGPGDFDGFIMSTGTMAHGESTADLHAFLSKFGSTPTVSLSTAVPNIVSVIIDNVSSVRELTKHLIEIHGKRRIAIVRVNSPEGEQRFEGYREALFEHGIAYDPALVVEGEFLWGAGEDAVRLFCDERKVGCDAIVGSNDWSAMGAMSALERRHIAVPEDIAVVGFDDVEDARFADPPLTSVSQPVRELGGEATRLLLKSIRGERVPMVKPVRTKLKLRQSCGCGVPKSRGMGSLVPGWEGPASARQEASVERWAKTMRRTSLRAIARLEGNWAEDLASALDGDLACRTEGAFLERFAMTVGRVEDLDSVSEWHDVIQVLRASCIPQLREDALQWTRAESMFERAHLLVAATAERVQGQRRFELQELLLLLNDTSRELTNLREDQAVLRTVASHLPRLRIPSFYVARAPRHPDPDGESSLLLTNGVEQGTKVVDELPFRAGEWLPVDVSPKTRHTLIVQPISFGMGATGYCVAELGPTAGIVYESVREMLDSGLRNARLLRQLGQEASRRE